MTHTLHLGSVPLLVSLPHMGTRIPDDLRPGYVPRALGVEDTDWHMDRLYGFARALGEDFDQIGPMDEMPALVGAQARQIHAQHRRAIEAVLHAHENLDRLALGRR